MPGADPDLNLDCPEAVEMVIIPRTSDLGNFEVKRTLPFRDKRMVGPFIFWDEMGPGEFLTGQGLDVRPHPHIGLSTVTYLFRGSIHHKDSLGTDQTVFPGDLNVMTAGRGIVHSERTGQEVRQGPSELAGIQSWIAQPKAFEEGSPGFAHTEKAEMPFHQAEGISVRVMMGQAYGMKSPVENQWDTLYLDVVMEPGAHLPVPKDTEERAIYGLFGKFQVGGDEFEPNRMLVLKPGKEVSINALEPVHLMILGGAVMDGPRYVWWNFVSSSREKIEEAKNAWRGREFPLVPGDEVEFTPLPEGFRNK